MIIVLVPVVLLFVVLLIKKIPFIGGNILVALGVTGLASLLMGGMYNPIDWLSAWIDGLDRLAWIIALSVVGGIYAETQTRIGTMETVLNALRARFGRSPKGLITCIMIALAISGSLIGDAVASSAVIGVLVIAALAEMRLTPEQTAATVVCGASCGSIMPPITQAIVLASSLAGADPEPVMRIGYITVGITLIVCIIYMANAFVKIKALPENLIPKEKANEILRKNGKTLIPLLVLVVLVVLRTGFKIDVATMIFGPFLKWLSSVKILKGLSNLIVFNLIMATVAAIFYKAVYTKMGDVFKKAVKNVWPCVSVQLAAAFMVGAFYAAGQITAVQDFAQGLNSNLIKLGGAAALCLVGMLTGSQTTAQNAVFAILAPVLVSLGLDKVNVAVAGAHLAMSGQGMPPACLTTFVVCGLVGAITGKKSDPVKTMILNLPMCLMFLAIGILFMYI